MEEKNEENSFTNNRSGFYFNGRIILNGTRRKFWSQCGCVERKSRASEKTERTFQEIDTEAKSKCEKAKPKKEPYNIATLLI